MNPADDQPVDPASQTGETDSRDGKWKPHRVRAGSHKWEDVHPPADPGVHRKCVEPWLAALLQAEHVSLLAGGGLTTAIARIAGAPVVEMKASPFDCDLAAAVDRTAAESAKRSGRGEPNLEDQLRAARELIAGLRILSATGGGDEFATRASGLLAAWETALDERLRALLHAVLATERGIGAAARQVAERAARKNARDANAKNAIPPAHTGEAPAWLAERAAAFGAYFAEHPSLKNADYRELFDLGRDAAARELRRLVQEGYLRREGERRGARYLPGPALRGAKE
jgi:hypothetical protein